jgi:hypothetical protein
MTNADERIDQILRGLSAVEVPARLEQRVIAQVAQRTADVSDSRFADWQAMAARFVASAGVCACDERGTQDCHPPCTERRFGCCSCAY